jgi:hypothetical protein
MATSPTAGVPWRSSGPPYHKTIALLFPYAYREAQGRMFATAGVAIDDGRNPAFPPMPAQQTEAQDPQGKRQVTKSLPSTISR